MIGEEQYAHFRESLDVIRAAGEPFDVEAYRAGRQTPVFFGSALTNSGLEPFLQALVDLAPPPQSHQSDAGIIAATDDRFSGFVFRSRGTWIRAIGIVSRLSACAPAGSRRTWRCPTAG